LYFLEEKNINNPWRLFQRKKYTQNIALLKTIPGIGPITSISFLVEIENIERFENIDHFASYVGLTSNRHGSGDNTNDGEMTFIGNKTIKSILTESYWTVARSDPDLIISYHGYVRLIEPNKAVARIARKVLNQMYYVLKNKIEYLLGVVK